MTRDTVCCQTESSWPNMDKDQDGVLGVKFHYKKLPDGCLAKTKVICSVCEAVCNYHSSNLSLTQHLKAKHPAETVCMEPCQSTLQECGAHGGITRPVRFHICVDCCGPF